MTEGVSVQCFKDEFGISLENVYGEVIEKHVLEGLLHVDEKHVRLTRKGMDVSNYVMADFLEP